MVRKPSNSPAIRQGSLFGLRGFLAGVKIGIDLAGEKEYNENGCGNWQLKGKEQDRLEKRDGTDSHCGR